MSEHDILQPLLKNSCLTTPLLARPLPMGVDRSPFAVFLF